MFTQSVVKELIGKKTTSIIPDDNLGVKDMQVSARTKHIDTRYHFMKALNDISIRFKRLADNSSDNMPKNTTKEIHERDSKRIKFGTPDFWKKDVKQVTSVVEYTRGTNSMVIGD
jgi:hypothetical protein